MKASLKNLVSKGAPEPAAVRPTGSEPQTAAPQARTRQGTRTVSAHFKPEVAQALRLLAAEQDREHQDMIAEALNMLFERYGKPTRAEVKSKRSA
jgi:hypothetical protein